MVQIIFLIKQELQSARRSRYIVLSFILMPILMWGMQAGVQFLTMSLVTDSGKGETLYITNADPSGSVLIPQDFNITINFANYTRGQTVVTNSSLILSEYFIARLAAACKDNASLLYGYQLNTTLDASTARQLAQQGKINTWIEIPSTFSAIYAFGLGNLTLHYVSAGLMGSSMLQAGLGQILGEEPFTFVTIQRLSIVTPSMIELGAAGESEFSLGLGLASFLGIMVAVMAPAPFVSTSFAGEREKKTLEALLSLPISRRQILLGKLSAGMVLVSIFAVMNIIGMVLFSIIMKMIPTPGGADAEASSYYAFDIDFIMLPAIGLVMMMSAFIAIGIGISIASLSKDVRTSESMYSTIMVLPTVVIGMLGMFVGVPEAMNEPLALLLYIIPWSHTLAIFNKIIRPGYYNVKALFGPGMLWLDLVFHFAVLFIIIGIILVIAAKIFDREGIVN